MNLDLLEKLKTEAERYAEQENDCYTNDYNGFMEGALWMYKVLNNEQEAQGSDTTKMPKDQKPD